MDHEDHSISLTSQLIWIMLRARQARRFLRSWDLYLRTHVRLVDRTLVVNLKQYLSTILGIGDFNSSVLDLLSAYPTSNRAAEYSEDCSYKIKVRYYL